MRVLYAKKCFCQIGFSVFQNLVKNFCGFGKNAYHTSHILLFFKGFMKFLFVTGGVLSGIGKGITAASIGTLLKASGQRVFMQKFDGYLNVDPGTMSPFEHGEVFVTDDGAETDLDLGHYERFIDESLSTYSSYSAGKLYQEILDAEREGR